MDITREQGGWRLRDLVEVAEAADLLDVTPQAVRLMAAKSRLHGVKIGTTWVFLRSEVERYRKPRASDERSGRCPPECAQNWQSASDPFRHVEHCPDYQERP